MSRLFLLFVFLSATLSTGVAQQHVFTDKQNRQIVAEIVKVYPDWKMMTIKKDGKDFDIEVNILSLDDQQHVKDWLGERGINGPGQTGNGANAGPAGVTGGGTGSPMSAPPIDLASVRLDVRLDKKQVDSERRRYSDYYRLETDKVIFDIGITSMGRETIPSPKVSYALVWDERVYFSDSSYYTASYEEKFAIKGEKQLEKLTYNRAEKISTEPVEINSVTYDGGQVYRKDELLGIVVQLTLPDGSVLGEFRSKEAENAGLTWSAVSKLRSNPQNGGMITSLPNDDGNDISARLRKGQSVDGPVSWVGKRISISAKANPSTSSPDGVIVAIGGEFAGVSLFVKDRKVYGCVNHLGKFVTVSRPLPLGSFEAKMELTASGLSLEVDGASPAKTDAALFQRVAEDGITVGTDLETPAGPYPAGFDFDGEIEEVVVLIRE